MEYTIGLRCKMYRVVPFYFLNFVALKITLSFFDFFFLFLFFSSSLYTNLATNIIPLGKNSRIDLDIA